VKRRGQLIGTYGRRRVLVSLAQGRGGGKRLTMTRTLGDANSISLLRRMEEGILAFEGNGAPVGKRRRRQQCLPRRTMGAPVAWQKTWLNVSRGKTGSGWVKGIAKGKRKS